MLTNQTFSSVPLVVTGPELFYAPDGALKVNFERIQMFRSRIENFTFIYAAVQDSSKYGDQHVYYKRLVELGVPISSKIIVSKAAALDDMELRANIAKLALTADLIFSPEFVGVFKSLGQVFSNQTNYEKYSADFVETLMHFTRSMEPFSKKAFFDYYRQQIWPKPAITG
jgi:hypothetical protein